MSNRNNNYDRAYYENEQYFPNQTSPRQPPQVVEIPVIHYPSSSSTIQNNSNNINTNLPSESYSPNATGNNFHPHHHHQQHIPPNRPHHSGFQQQAPSLFDTFDSPFELIDSNRNRRAFQDPDLDDFFTPAFQPREYFSDRNPGPLFNRLGSDHLINPRTKLSPNRHSPAESPKLSPRSNRKINQDPVTIPVNYAKSPTKSSTFEQREPSESRDLPFGAYKTTQNPSPKPGSFSDRNFNYPQASQTKAQEPIHKHERTPSPPKTANTRTSPPTQSKTASPAMGNSANSNIKQPKPQDQYQQSSFVQLASEAAGFQTPPRSTTPQMKVVKTPQEKIDEITSKLESYEKEVENYVRPEGKKKDKQFLLLEECLTQCLLQLDEIDRSDDKINQVRRKLIGNTQLLIDKLESKFNTDSNDSGNNSNSNNNNNNSETNSTTEDASDKSSESKKE